MTLLEKGLLRRGDAKECIVCGQLKGDDDFINKRYKTCIACVCADLGRKPGAKGRPRKVEPKPPIDAEPVAGMEPPPIKVTAKRPSGVRPPLLRIPKVDEVGLPPRWV